MFHDFFNLKKEESSFSQFYFLQFYNNMRKLWCSPLNIKNLATYYTTSSRYYISLIIYSFRSRRE